MSWFTEWLFRDVLAKLQHIEENVLHKLHHIKEELQVMSAALDALILQVEQVKTVEASAVAAIQGILAEVQALTAELAAAGADTAKIEEMTASLAAATQPLAEAIANIPA
jgi:hypothetical protein